MRGWKCENSNDTAERQGSGVKDGPAWGRGRRRAEEEK